MLFDNELIELISDIEKEDSINKTDKAEVLAILMEIKEAAEKPGGMPEDFRARILERLDKIFERYGWIDDDPHSQFIAELPKSMKHVFISYVHEDSEMVIRFSEQLTSKGINVWLDRNNILPGVRWKDAIREAIQEGNFFIACFSQAYYSRNKTYMNEELTLAIEELRQFSAHRAWFIPVLLSDCKIPNIDIGAGKTLNDIQAVLLYENWDNGVKRIIDIIQPVAPEKIRWQKIITEHYRRPHKPRCEICGSSYRTEKMYICSACGSDYCTTCVRELEKIEDETISKWKCPCGGKLL